MTAMAPKRAQGLWSELVYIDLLCGPGKDIDRRTGDEFDGSPLIALATQPPFDKVILGDADRHNISALSNRIRQADVQRVDLQCADCHVRARQVVASMRPRTLGLAFIDPEGFEVRHELFETFSQRPIDVLFLFPSGIGITRNLRAFARQQHSPLDDLMGGTAWRQLPIAKLHAGEELTAAETERLTHSWVMAFRLRVAELGYKHHESVDPLRNEQNAPMYHLLFFSKHTAGLTIFRGISQIDARGQRHLRLE
jgi:three-Cys-motif partner protein